MLSREFGSVLRSGRDEFNRRFAEARRINPDLDSARFTRFLEVCVDPLVSAAGKVCPDQTASVASAAYDASLELVTQGLTARYEPLIAGLWTRVLVPAVALVATQPQRAIASLCNALHHLASTPATRPEQWIKSLEQVWPLCPDLDTVLRAGQVAAWRAGLAHFRQSAIATADSLPETVAVQTAGASPQIQWQEVKARLLADPWDDTTNNVVDRQSRLRVAAEAGSFRGFGGLFPAPPVVACLEDRLYVRSADEVWLLTADAFGSTFHRATTAEFDAAPTDPDVPKGWRVGKQTVDCQRQNLDFSDSGGLSSFAVSSTTLALTLKLSHSVILIPLRVTPV